MTASAVAKSSPTPSGGGVRRCCRRIAQIVELEGWRSLWFRSLAALGYQRTGCLVVRLDEAGASQPPTVPVHVRMLTAEDAEAYVAFRRGAAVSDVHERLGRGFVCYAGWCEGRLASVTWVATGRALLWMLEAQFDVAPDQVYLFDSFTHPDFRGQRIQSAVFAALRADALAAGRTRGMTFVIPENRPNMKSRGRMGFVREGLVGRVKLGPLQWYFSRGRAPALRRWDL